MNFHIIAIRLAFVNILAPLTIRGSIVRLPCKMQADFDVSLQHLALSSTPLSTFTQTDRRKCILKCVSHLQCKCANHNERTAVCEIFSESFNLAVNSLVANSGWSFIATTDEAPSCFSRPNPCRNGGICLESCNRYGYECQCPDDYYGSTCADVPVISTSNQFKNGLDGFWFEKNCKFDYNYNILDEQDIVLRTKHLQSLLDGYCSSSVFNPSLARYDGKLNAANYEWRCYKKSTLRSDGLFWDGSNAEYFTRYNLNRIIDMHQKAEEYVVGLVNKSCSETCSSQSKSCSPSIRTLDSVYMFKMAGITCKYPKTSTGSLSAIYINKEDPVFIPSNGFCYGFIRVSATLDCLAKHPEKRRLCRCL